MALCCHIFIQIYFRMHQFVVKFSQFSLPQAAIGIDPLTKILWTPLDEADHISMYMSLKCCGIMHGLLDTSLQNGSRKIEL